MINDILEQLTEDYLRHKGYFTQHNVKYRPNRKGNAYAVHSDIDIVAVNPQEKGTDRIVVVSCKSWHGGLHIKRDLLRLKNNYKRTQKIYRELYDEVWSQALKQKVKELTGQDRFIFYSACISFNRDHKEMWEQNKDFLKNLQGCKIKLLDFRTMIEDLAPGAEKTTPAHSELSRLLQFIYHSGGGIKYN